MDVAQPLDDNTQQSTGVGVSAKTIALMRLVLALFVTLNASFYFQPKDGYQAFTVYFACAYTFYTLLVYAFPVAMAKAVRYAWLHWVDFCAYVTLIVLSGGQESQFFPFLFFTILVASFRFGSGEGLRVTIACALLSALIHFFPISPVEGPLFPALENTATLLLLGYLIANWGGVEVIQKRQLLLLNDINRLPDPHLSAEQAMGESLEHIRNFYAAGACIAIMKMPDAGYSIFRVDRDAAKPRMLGQPLDGAIVSILLALEPERVVSYKAQSRLWLSSTKVYGPAGRVTKDPSDCGEAIAQLLEADRFISVPLLLHGQDIGRIYITNCYEYLKVSDISFLQQVINQIAPFIENIHLLDNIAVAATTTIRRQISLDLHDSTIQPYIGLKLGLEALRRKISVSDAIAADVDDLVDMTAESIGELRQYVGVLKAHLKEPLIPAIKHVVEKYQNSYGIEVSINASPDLQLHDRLAAAIYQMVCEALSNIRRHTNASQAAINLSTAGGEITVQVINPDDVTKISMLFQPRSISERVSYLGGCVNVERLADGRTVVTARIPLQYKEARYAEYS